MLRLALALSAWLICGTALGADLDVLPKSEERVAPAPPVPLQQTQPPTAPQKQEQAAPEPPDSLEPPLAGPPPGEDSWWQKVVREAPTCKSFSDGCRTCSPSYTCSGLPIACQPKEFTCVDPKPADKKP